MFSCVCVRVCVVCVTGVCVCSRSSLSKSPQALFFFLCEKKKKNVVRKNHRNFETMMFWSLTIIRGLTNTHTYIHILLNNKQIWCPRLELILYHMTRFCHHVSVIHIIYNLRYCLVYMYTYRYIHILLVYRQDIKAHLAIHPKIHLSIPYVKKSVRRERLPFHQFSK